MRRGFFLPDCVGKVLKTRTMTIRKLKKGIKKIYIIHENSEWMKPLRRELDQLNVPYEEWFINEGQLDISQVPPEGIFYNRMSASSHTRDHRYAVEMTGPILAWLESHDRRIINNRRALQLEVRKIEQYLSLSGFGIPTPRTIAVNGKKAGLKAAGRFGSKPFIYKPNRGGKGVGVQLFRSYADFEKKFSSEELSSLDGIGLIQEYIEPADGSITRMEFIGAKFFYAVKVDTSEGFELCPADDCQVGDAYCPTEPADGSTPKAKFEILQGYENHHIPMYEAFLQENGMEIAAIEYIVAKDGKRYVYDVNINTNYNGAAEAHSDKKGMQGIASFLADELLKITSPRRKRSHKKVIVSS